MKSSWESKPPLCFEFLISILKKSKAVVKLWAVAVPLRSSPILIYYHDLLLSSCGHIWKINSVSWFLETKGAALLHYWWLIVVSRLVLKSQPDIFSHLMFPIFSLNCLSFSLHTSCVICKFQWVRLQTHSDTMIGHQNTMCAPQWAAFWLLRCHFQERIALDFLWWQNWVCEPWLTGCAPVFVSLLIRFRPTGFINPD